MKGKRVIRGVLIGLAGLLVLLFAAVQIALNSRVLTRAVNRIAAEFVDGNVSFSKVHASAFRSFPHLNVTLDDCVLTYPHARFAAYDSLCNEDLAARRFSLVKAGWGESGVDTLASFRQLSASVNYISVLKGDYDIRHVTLSRPRIFAHRYDSTAANWNILPLGSKDTTDSTLPPVTVRKIDLTDRPLIIFTDPADTLFGLFTLRNLHFDGQVLITEPLESQIGLKIDSLFVSGRLPADTVALAVDKLRLEGGKRCLDLDMAARTFLATQQFGRMTVPVRIKGSGCMPERADSAMAVSVKDLLLNVASLEMTGFGDAVLYPDSTFLRAEVSIADCAVAPVLEQFKRNFPVLGKVRTDAVISLTALCDGYYNPARGTLPELLAELVVPRAYVDYEGLGRRGYLSLNASAETNPDLRLDVDVRDLMVDILGIGLSATGSAKDLLGGDPAFRINGNAKARVDSLTQAFTRDRGITGTGRLTLDLEGQARLSQLDAVHIGNATLNGNLHIRDLRIEDRPDSLSARVPKGTVNISTMANTLDKNLKKGTRVLGLKADLDTLDLVYKEALQVHGGGLRLLAHTAASVLKTRTSSLPPFMGLFQGKNIDVKDDTDLTLRLQDTKETFRIAPPTKELGSPKLTLTSQNGHIGARQGVNRVTLEDARFDISANLHQANTATAARRKHFLDSLQRVYPGTPRDSLLAKLRAGRQLPAWMQEADFRKKDISLNLGETVAKYMKEWDVKGNLSIADGQLMTPAFPLENGIRNAAGSFDNDRIDLGNVTITSGASDISGKATLTGLRRALTGGKGFFRLKAKLTSKNIDVNEILRAYAFSRTYRPDAAQEQKNENTSDAAYQAEIARTELPDSAGGSLIVLPANLDAEIGLEASRIRYDSLNVTWAASDIALRQRCLQVTNTVATSNMGDIYFEGFYSTRTKKDLRAGFDLNLVDITAEKVITLMPAVDTIIPMLKSFGGLLDCEMAVTSAIDEGMNLVLPSIDGIMRISGKNLSLKDSEQFTKIAKYLLFKNKAGAYVDKMSVNGMLRDNTLEVFPFVLDIDRYTFAASGIQHFDESFQYHISVIKSPIPFRFGLNISGDSFDKLKFRPARAKYKDVNVPVFTTQLKTVQVNLVNSIHNIFELGVEKAIRQNESQQLVERQKAKEGYSAEADAGELSAEEQAELKKAQHE